jgi:hypothetical protein
VEPASALDTEKSEAVCERYCRGTTLTVGLGAGERQPWRGGQPGRRTGGHDNGIGRGRMVPQDGSQW